jgi:hypothetical protein
MLVERANCAHLIEAQLHRTTFAAPSFSLNVRWRDYRRTQLLRPPGATCVLSVAERVVVGTRSKASSIWREAQCRSPKPEGNASKLLRDGAVRREGDNNQPERARDLGEVKEEEADDHGGAGSFPYS